MTTMSSTPTQTKVNMCGLFEYAVHGKDLHTAPKTVYASSIRGVLGKVSRLIAKRDDFAQIGAVVVYARHDPNISFKRFYESGEPISPWLVVDTKMDEV